VCVLCACRVAASCTLGDGRPCRRLSVASWLEWLKRAPVGVYVMRVVKLHRSWSSRFVWGERREAHS
jgi:hypothetical protein